MSGARLQSSKPAWYEIIVFGHLDASWSSRLGGLRIANREENGRAIAVLTGGVVDQAELLGVLTTLYAIGLPLRSVEQLAAEGEVP